MIQTSKKPRDGRSKGEAQVAKLSKEFMQTRMSYAKIASGLAHDYYNPKSNLLAIESGGQIYFTYLIGKTFEHPDAQLHDVLWLRLPKVDAMPANRKIPDKLPDTMPISVSFLIPRTDRPSLIASGSNASAESGFRSDDPNKSKKYLGKQDGDISQRTGLIFGEEGGHVLLKGPGTEISMTEDHININGKIVNNDLDGKSIFEENPLSYIVPSTIVTFPIAYNYLPDMQKIDNLGEILSQLNDARALISAISNL